MRNFVATDIYALFNSHVMKSATSDLVEDNVPKGAKIRSKLNCQIENIKGASYDIWRLPDFSV